MRIAAAQLAPVLLDRAATSPKVVAAVKDAASRGTSLVAFGESGFPRSGAPEAGLRRVADMAMDRVRAERQNQEGQP